MSIYMVQNKSVDLSQLDVIHSFPQKIEFQNQFDCQLLTYWFDELKKSIFYLFEAPDKESVISLLIKFGINFHPVLKINNFLTEFYLNYSQKEDTLAPSKKNKIVHKSSKVIVAFFINLILNQKNINYTEINNNYQNNQFLITKNLIEKHQGNIIEYIENSFVCSFTNATNAITCAIELQKNFLPFFNNNHPLSQIKIGINMGKLKKGKSSFNDTIKHTKHLCCFSNKNQMVVSKQISNLLKNEGYSLDKNLIEIKILNSNEENFVHQLMNTLIEKLKIQNFTINDLAINLGISKSKLYRKIISLTNRSPQNFINEYKLIRALYLIKQGSKNLSEIAYETGFGSPSYFSKCFKKHYKIIPSDIKSDKI